MENRDMGDAYEKDKCFEDHSIMHPCSASSSELEEIDFHTPEDLCGESVSDEDKNPCNITSEQEIVSEDTCSDKIKSACVKYYPITMTQEVQCEAVSIDICSGLMNSVYVQYDQIEMKTQGVQCTWNRRDQGTQTDLEVSLQSSGALGPTTCSCSKVSTSNQQLKSSCEKDSSNSGSDEKLTDSVDEHSGTAPLPFGPSFEGKLDEAPSSHSTSSSLLPLGNECSESSCSASEVPLTQCVIIRSSSLEENKMCCSVLETSDGVEIVNNENERSEGSSQCNVLKSLNKDCRSHTTFNSCLLKQKTEGNVEECRGEFSQNIEKSHETVSPANKSSDNVDIDSSVRKLLSQSGVIEESSETGDHNTQSTHSENRSSHSATNNSPLKNKKQREMCRGKVKELSNNIEKSLEIGCPSDKGDNNLDKDRSAEELILQMGNIEDSSKSENTQSIHGENRSLRSSHSAINNSALKNKKRRELCTGKVRVSSNIENSHEFGCPGDKGNNNLDDPSAEELILQMGNIEVSSENEDTQSIHGENRISRRSHSAINTSPLKKKKRQEVDVREVCRGKIKESSNIEKSCETNSPGDKISNNMDEVSSAEDLLEIECNENIIEDSHCRYGRIMSVIENAEKRRLPSPKPDVSRSSSTQAASEGINLPCISSLAVERCSSPESLEEVMPEDTQKPNIIRQRKFFRKKRKLVNEDDIWLSDCEENDTRSDKLTGEASAPKPTTSRKRPLVLYSDDTSCDSYEQSGSGTSYAAGSRSAVKRRTETVSVDSDTDSDSESVNTVYFVNHNNRKPLKHPRRPYTERERESIVAYIVDHKLYHCTGGNAMWKHMEREKICPDHPWQSMREHFRKQILPHIGSYGLPSKVVQRFLQQRKT